MRILKKTHLEKEPSQHIIYDVSDVKKYLVFNFALTLTHYPSKHPVYPPWQGLPPPYCCFGNHEAFILSVYICLIYAVGVFDVHETLIITSGWDLYLEIVKDK